MPEDSIWSLRGLAKAGENGIESTVGTVYGLSGRSTNVPDSSLTQSQYDFENHVFPEDLGNENNGHYIVFNINVPVTGDGAAATQRTALQTGDKLLPGDYSKVDVLRFGGFPAFGGRSAQLAALPRGTRRIARSIAMYVPTQLMFDTGHKYEDVSLTALGGEILTGALRAGGQFAQGLGNIPGGGLLAALTGAAGTAASGLLNNIPNLSRIAGKPINPLMEVLFSHTFLREYTFEFLMVPRNEREAKTVRAIISNFRYWSAPEIDPDMSLFFIPPAEFDITLYHNGEENTNIPRFNTSVLKRIQVNYIPFNDHYTTYQDGNPVGVLMTLHFQELEILHKQRVLQGF